jgi:UDP-2-acetamido-3-amino-2,3-dideoxy-glucuronate N-acetyltransferase
MDLINSVAQVAVIGCGAWGKNLVRNFHQLGALATVVERNPEVCQRLESEYGITTRSLESVLADDSIQGVVVALAARHHTAVAQQVLNAGKHIFIEKPMTLSYGEALELANLATVNRCSLMVGHLPRYHPVFQKLVDLISEGEVGQVKYVYSHRLNLGRIRADENPLWDLAPHDLSMIMAITGQEPCETSSQLSCCVDPTVSDSAMVNLAFPNGIKAHIYNSWMHPFKEQRFVVIGTDGMMVFDDTMPWDKKLIVYHHRIEKENALDYLTEAREGTYIAVAQDEPLKLECQHFLDCIVGQAEPLTGVQDALSVMKVLEQIQPTSPSLLKAAQG